jgi:hypothetical protein
MPVMWSLVLSANNPTHLLNNGWAFDLRDYRFLKNLTADGQFSCLPSSSELSQVLADGVRRESRFSTPSGSGS